MPTLSETEEEASQLDWSLALTSLRRFFEQPQPSIRQETVRAPRTIITQVATYKHLMEYANTNAYTFNSNPRAVTA